jgi:succinate dehydrogenase / fumarate reductase cytochrome b subunit
MSVATRILAPSIGRKAVMAVTGAVLFGFVIIHMLGNLQVLLGAERFNAYAAFLRGQPAIVWAARIVLLVSVVLHIWAAVSLARQRRAARPVPYHTVTPRAATYASRTMMMSGPILFAFIVYHLLHYTTGHAHPAFHPTDIYRNFVIGFSQPGVVALYVVAMALLGLHLVHGVRSFFQSVGAATIDRPFVRHFAVASVTVLAAANMLLPLTVPLGLVK